MAEAEAEAVPEATALVEEISSATALIKQICAGLGRYYGKKEAQGYFDEDGIGKFELYCRDNGYDDEEMLREELQSSAADSQLVEFDESFPVPADTDKAAKLVKILDVLRKCASEKNAFSNNYDPLDVKPDDWKVSAEQLEAVKDLYKTQFKTLFDSGMKNDKNILHVLAMERKLNAPYLLYLADVFTRERIRLKDDPQQKDFNVGKFAKTNRHFIKELSNHTTKPHKGKALTHAELAEAAIKSFQKRISPGIMLKAARVFCADIEKTCEHIASAVDFVFTKAKSKTLACPFQFDLVFAFQSAKETDIDVGAHDADDDDDDDEPEQEEEKRDEGFVDPFGDIAGKLEAEKLLYATSTVKAKARAFTDSFKAFVEDKEMGKKYKDYPHKRRFCGIVDGRKGDAETDDLTLFEPPDNCNSFPEREQDRVKLWNFDAARTCILPDEGYGAAEGNEKKKKALTCTHGSVMTLSFHVEGEDEIRCYLFVQGGSMRFFPQDIIDVLPIFFDKEFGDNAKWTDGESTKGKAAIELVETMTPQLGAEQADPRFDAFYNMCKE